MPITLDHLISEVNNRRPDGSALDRLSDAAEIAQHLDDLADHVVGHFVDQARRAGASWTMIGQSMGVTKQAAQKRFSVGEATHDRFTNRAMIVVLIAQNEARDRGHTEVTSLHLLLGIAHEWGGLAGQALESLGISKETVSAASVAALPPNAKPRVRQVEFSAGMKKVHELIVREALRLGHNYVGTEHILLGLLEATDEPGARLLSSLSVGKDAVEAWTLDALDKLNGLLSKAPPPIRLRS